jgi:hypothetical protein
MPDEAPVIKIFFDMYLLPLCVCGRDGRLRCVVLPFADQQECPWEHVPKMDTTIDPAVQLPLPAE